MITTIRRTIKQSTSRYIMLFLLGTIVIGLIVPSFLKQGPGGNSWAIRVNGKEISYHDFAYEVARQSQYLAQIRAQYGQYADMLMQSMGLSTDPKSLAFDTLVREELISQCAKALGIHLHADYITESINDAAFAQKHLSGIVPPFVFEQSGILNKDILANYLQQQGISARSFEQKVEAALMQYNVINLAISTMYTPLFDLKQHYIAEKLGKKFSVIRFSLSHFLEEEKKKELTQQDLQIFYDSQNHTLRRYWVPEKRNGIMWKIDPNMYAISVTDAQVQEYYENNKVSKYVEHPVKIQVRQISEEQLEGKSDISLESVRAELVENPSSEWARKWQKVEPIVRTKKGSALERAAFFLKEEGEISPIIETDEGNVIIQLVKRIPRTYKALSSVKAEIVEALTQKKFKQEFVKDLKAIASKDSLAVEEFIAHKKGKKEVVRSIAKDNSHQAQELFALKKGEYAFYIEEDAGVVIQLTDITERYLPSLETIKDVVTYDLQEERALASMQKMVEEARFAAQTHQLDETEKGFWKKFHGKLEQMEMIHPGDTKKVEEIEKDGFPVREFMGIERVGGILVHTTDQESFLVKLEELEDFDENKFEQAKKELRKHVGPKRMRFYLAAFVASLHRNATIETNNSLFIPSEEYSE